MEPRLSGIVDHTPNIKKILKGKEVYLVKLNEKETQYRTNFKMKTMVILKLMYL